MSGTAGEKILGTPHKYRDLDLPLAIILIAFQEIDDQDVFDCDDKQLEYIELWNR